MTNAASSRWRSVDGHDQACTSCGMSRHAAPAWTNAPRHSSAQNGREHQPPRYSPGGAHQSQGSRLMGGAHAEAGERWKGTEVSPAAPVTCGVLGYRADGPAGPHHRPVSRFRLQNGHREQQHLSWHEAADRRCSSQPSVGFRPTSEPRPSKRRLFQGFSLSCKVCHIFLKIYIFYSVDPFSCLYLTEVKCVCVCFNTRDASFWSSTLWTHQRLL